MTHKQQQQQATFVQVFGIMFEIFLTQYKKLCTDYVFLEVSNQDIAQSKGQEMMNLRLILKSYLWLYNALPDEEKASLHEKHEDLIDDLTVDG